MFLLLQLLSTSMQLIESCLPTAPTTMPTRMLPRTTCDYHSLTKAPPAPEIPDMDTTCYTLMGTATSYDVLGRTTVQTRRGCEIFCNRLTKCVAFSFKDAGFSSSCALLSDATNKENCAQPTTIYIKETTGCGPRIDIMAEFGDDPCVYKIVPEAFHGVDTVPTNPICDVRWTNNDLFIIRAIDEIGNRITMDNERWNTIRKVGKMWEYAFLQNGNPVGTVKIVAAVCALADNKCPCKPLGLLPDNTKTMYDAKTEVINTCRGTNSELKYDAPKSPNFIPEWMDNADTAAAIVQCKATKWILWKESVNSSWEVSALGCYTP